MTNADNYQKDWLQRRILSTALANGLLTVEDSHGNFSAERWRIFARKTVLTFTAAMIEAAEALVGWLHQREGQVVDLPTRRRVSPSMCWNAPSSPTVRSQPG
jgi:hypothetical protein